MKINIYILCYNEELIIKNTIKHYKKRFPDSQIILLDNYSTDNSVIIARKYGCRIHQWKSDENNRYINEYSYLRLKNNIWKENREGWVIVCDMDELLEIDRRSLALEEKNGTTIIRTQGLNMVGESKKHDLSDINLRELTRGYFDKNYSKSVCFKVPDIREINYSPGAHKCSSRGRVIFSKNIYLLKHLNFLGENYLVQKILSRYQRKSQHSKSHGLARHYINDVEKIKESYKNALGTSREILFG